MESPCRSSRRGLLFLAASAVAGAGRASAGGLLAEKAPGGIRIGRDGREWLRYLGDPVPAPAGVSALQARGAYIHPLASPSGQVVTDDFPADHLHQRGVFFAWTRTALALEGRKLEPDFWNLGSGTGRIRAVEYRPTASGFQAVHVWEAAVEGKWRPVMDETWEVAVTGPAQDPAAPGAALLLDLRVTQTPRVEIELPQYRYGGMSVRGARAWLPANGGMELSTSEGHNWANANNTRPRWADMTGRVEGTLCGVALMEHPSNEGAPNPVRVPPQYPYVIYSPPIAGPLRLAAGKAVRYRYGVLSHNSRLTPAEIDQHWRRWTQA